MKNSVLLASTIVVSFCMGGFVHAQVKPTVVTNGTTSATVNPQAVDPSVAIDAAGMVPVVAVPGTAAAPVVDPQTLQQQQMLFKMLQQQQQQKGNNKQQSPNPAQMMGPLQNMMNGAGGKGGGQGSGGGGGQGSGGGGGGGSSSGPAVDNCPGAKPDPTALQTMMECTRSLSQATNRFAALVDIDKKVMFIIDRNNGGSAVKCVAISTGSGGVGGGHGQTPTGCLTTGPHHGDYQSTATGTQRDCIGLVGTDGETRARANNGVIMHKAHGGAGTTSTLGCIGVQDDEFDQIKEMLYGSDSAQKHSVVCNYTAETRGKCTIGQGEGSGGGGSSGGSSGSGTQSASGSTPARN